MQNAKCKMQNFFYLLIVACNLLLVTGCGKKQPYGLIKSREGEIKLISGEVDTFYSHSEFKNMSGATYLFAGKEANFEAMAFLYFEFDSSVLPESLWIMGEDSGQIQICKLMNSINMDSADWSSYPNLDLFNFLEIEKDTALSVDIQELDTNSVFSIGFSNTAGMASFYSSQNKGTKLWISIEDGDTTYYPSKSTYIDTSYFSQDSLPDSLTYIETGAYVTRCTLYLNTFVFDIADIVIDTVPVDSLVVFKTQIDSLTDSLRDAYSFNDITVNKAEFKIRVDTTLSYKWDNKIMAQYEVNGEKIFSQSRSIDGDFLTLSIKYIIEKWLKKGERLWLVLEGDTKKISRVILEPGSAELSVIYTLPPKER